MTQLKDGDIFHWRYKPERIESMKRFTCDPYWAKSCIAVVRNGCLEDTFWHGSDNARWTPDEADRDLELTYLGNFAGLTKVPEWLRDYYDDVDCVNLNHSNSPKGNFYIRNGACRSVRKMLEVANYKLEQAKSAVSSAERDVQRMENAIRELQGGTCDPEKVYL